MYKKNVFKARAILAGITLGISLVGTESNLVSAATQDSEKVVMSKSTENEGFTGSFIYTNGLPVKEGTEVRLRNTADGTVITKKTDANGQVTFTEADGIKKSNNYSVETAGYNFGYTFRSSVGTNFNKKFTVDLPEASLPLTFTGSFVYTNGLPVKEGTEVRLRNTADGTVITKKTDANGQVTFTEADGIKKSNNYSVETAGYNFGYTFRSSVGTNFNKKFTVDLPEANTMILTKTVMHKAKIYNKDGKAIGKKILAPSDVINVTSDVVTIQGTLYYKLVNTDQYIKVNNVDGTKRKIKHNSLVYTKNGKLANHRKLLKKGSIITTYGAPTIIKHKKVFKIGKNRYIKAINLELL